MMETLGDIVKSEVGAVKFEHPANLGGLLTLVEAGKIPYPFLTSAELWRMTISSPEPFFNKSTGYMEYPVFNQAEEGSEKIIGIPYTLDRLGSYINTTARANDKKRILIMVGPSGAGKSLLVERMFEAFERKAGEIGPFYTIGKCPVQDNPLKLLGPKARQSAWEKFHFHIVGKICPDCRERYRELMRDQEKVLDIPVANFEYSSADGIGLSQLDPKDTKPLETESWTRINRIILGASRGLLVLNEIINFNPDFFGTTHDLLRGRKHKIARKVYYPDVQIIALTTTPEWKDFQSPDSRIPLVERMVNIYVPYNNSIKNEAAIYSQSIGEFMRGTGRHLAPRMLEYLGEIAVRSRLLGTSDYITKKLNAHPELKRVIPGVNDMDKIIAVKLALFNNEPIAGFTVTQDRVTIEDEGIKKFEGLQLSKTVEGSGAESSNQTSAVITPPFMSGKLYMMLNDFSLRDSGQAVLGDSVGKKPDVVSCLSPFKAEQFFQDLIDNTPNEFLKCRGNLNAWKPEARKSYERWLEQEVRSAFLIDFENTVERRIDEYIENIDILRNDDIKVKEKRNPITKQMVPINQKTVEILEDSIHGKNLTTEERRQFRLGVLMGDDQTMPIFQEGIRKIVRQEENKAEKILLKEWEERSDADMELYNRAMENLMSVERGEDRFCVICSKEAMDRVTLLLKSRQPKK